MTESERPGDADAPQPDENKRPGPLARIFDAALWVLAIGIFAVALWPKDSGPDVGTRGVRFSLPIVGESGTFSFDGERDRPLLIEAFASWCSACRRNNHLLDTLGRAADEGRLDVIAVSVDDEINEARHAKDSWPITVPVLHDTGGQFQRDYGVSVLPTYILIDENGQVIDVSAGPAGATDIRRWLKAAE